MPDANTVYPKFEKDIAKLRRKLDDVRQKAASQKRASQSLEDEVTATEEGLNALEAEGRGNLDELMEQFNALLAEYEKVATKLQALSAPPFGIVTFVRFIRMEKTDKRAKDSPEIPLIEVKDTGGRVARVFFVDETKDVHTLKYGQRLVIATNCGSTVNHVLETLNEFKTEGVPGSVVEVLAADHNGVRFLVSTSENGTPQVMHAISTIEADALKKGSRVLADPAAGFVLEKLPVLETSDKFLVAEVPDVTFDDIGGLDALKKEIKEWLIHPILFPKTAKRMGEPRPKGCVFQGPPGVGKTMTAKAIVNDVHALQCAQLGLDPKATNPLFYSVDGPKLLDKYVGESERKIRELFAEARRKSAAGIPVGIFIDEAESLLGIRGSGISSDVEKTIVPMFTAEMQGLEEKGSENVFVILASNLAHNIDAAVKRPGRCDQIFTVPRPDRVGARQIFEKYLEASWEQLHPQYNMDVYPELDKNGKPQLDASGKPIKVQFGCDPKRVREYLIEKVVERIFDEPTRSKVGAITYEGIKEKQIIQYGDLVSGALIASIVKRAKRFSRVRYTNSLAAKGMLHRADELVDAPAHDLIKDGIEPPGVRLEDLLKAVEKVYGEIKAPNDTRAIRHWLLIEGLAQGRDVQDFSFTGNPEMSGHD